MPDKYQQWIDENVSGDGRGQCKEVTESMQKVFPELRRVRGHYYCMVWGEREHWWLVKPTGEIVDPTVQQFPSKGVGVYVEWDEEQEEPIGRCMHCGEYCYESKGGDSNFCSAECASSEARECSHALWERRTSR